MSISTYSGLKKTWVSFPDLLRLIEKDKQDSFLREYQTALSLFAEHFQDTKRKIIVSLDGRDTAGKGSNIKRVIEQLDIRRFNITAFDKKPTDEEKSADKWFQRYENFFPDEGKIRFFDRSWYNRIGVEAAMSFCTQEEYDWFIQKVADFEKNRIIDAGYDFHKIYLSIKKDTQKERLKEREGIRKAWKSSPVDKKAQEKWDYYTLAEQRTLELTDSKDAPWTVIDSNEKHLSSVEIIKMIISTSDEIRKMVEKDLSIDLSPNKKIRRTATQELQRMRKAKEIPTKHDSFIFDDSRVNEACKSELMHL